MSRAVITAILFVGLVACQSTVVITDSATTITNGIEEATIDATTQTFKDTTLTIVATTSEVPAGTVTRPEETETITYLPSALAGITNPQAASDIFNFASTVSSLNPSQVSQAVSDLESFYASIRTQAPYVLYQAGTNLRNAFTDGDLDEITYREVVAALEDPWDATLTSEAVSMLTGSPSLSSMVIEALSAGKPFLAESQSSVASIVSKDLSLSGSPPSSFASATSAAGATTTGSSSSSSAMAGVTARPYMVVNAGAMVVGVAALVLI